MSKCVKTIPLSQVERISVASAGGRSLAQVKAACGCDCVINGGLYDFGSGKPVSHLKVAGTVYAKEVWGAWGYAWDKGPDISMVPVPHEAAGKANYITCVHLLTPWDGIGAKLSYPAELGGKRGRTAMALTGDSLILYCSGDGTADGKTPEELRAELYGMGAVTALMLDSGSSSQCDLGGGAVINSSRRVNNYICVWLKHNEKEDKPMDTKIACLDPGHGPDTVNGSPDGSYKEREFAWDMYTRVRPLLEARGVKVIVTRTENTKPSLTDRAKVSNNAGADLFVSLHTNAFGSGGWDAASGLLIYTSMAGDSAGRNKAARAILARMEKSGVALHGSGLAHNIEYTVLAKTNAPAVLIEYGFHTNKADVALLKDSAYRDKLARATAAGICDYLGVAWEDGTEPEKPQEAPWYAEAVAWAVAHGITADGSRPEDPATRAEVCQMLYNALKGRI